MKFFIKKCIDVIKCFGELVVEKVICENEKKDVVMLREFFVVNLVGDLDVIVVVKCVVLGVEVDLI